MKILAIGAHPADCIDLAGGTLCKHAEAGDSVHIISVTDGLGIHGDYEEKIDASIKYFKCRNIKRLELDFAARVLGIDTCMFLNKSDEPLLESVNIIHGLADAIRKVKPNIVLSHHPNEYSHWDHATCGKMVCRALKAATRFYDTDIKERWYVPAAYFYAVQFRPETERIGYVPQAPTVLVDIEDVIDKKIDAMAEFKSQGITKEYMQERVKSFEGEMGRADGLKYSEGFISYYPQKTDLLPTNKPISFYTKKEETYDRRKDQN